MSLVIIYGKVVSNIEFKFIYDRYKLNELSRNENEIDSEKYNHISIASCKIELKNESIVEIYGYDNVADFMYVKLNKRDTISIEGNLKSNGRIETQMMTFYLKKEEL